MAEDIVDNNALDLAILSAIIALPEKAVGVLNREPGSLARSVETIIRSYLAKSCLRSSGRGVGVKPLDWRDHSFEQSVLHIGYGAFEDYRITKEDYPEWPFVLRPFISGQSNYQTLDEARAAAETDYEKRIRSALIEAPVEQVNGWKLVPIKDTEAMWSGLARQIVLWHSMRDRSGAALYQHLRSSGMEIPDWLPELIPDTDHAPPKGAICGAIYRAMLDAAPAAPPSQPVNDFASDALRLPDIDPSLPFDIFKWAATIDAHAKTCIEDHGADAVNKMACIRHNVRDLLKAFASQPVNGELLAAKWTHSEVEGVGHHYYVAYPGRQPPPYRSQREVTAIIDIADDGTLAGVELIDRMPPPPAAIARAEASPVAQPGSHDHEAPAMSEDDAISEAAMVFANHGIEFCLPWNGDLDDLERERYEALVEACRAYTAALAPSPSEAER